jgi:metal-responsive CopG/Arc/MetJ family transcriptional regulator
MAVAMRQHVTLDDGLVRQLDELVGTGRRSSFIARAVRRALEEERWAMIEAAIGTIPAEGHEWDADPAAWVRDQRRSV